MRKIFIFYTMAMFFYTSAFAQNRIITGIVKSADGTPVFGASVVVKGYRNGTNSNADGTFSLSVNPKAKTLVISSVGMAPREIAIGNALNFSIILNADVRDLSEVLVQVPYGTVRKTAFTGAENTITAATLQKQQVTDVSKALEGLIPGLSATNGGGAPGSSADILIRGIGSINATSAPLYVLNGVPYDGSLTALGTDDIESVTVLKDASASALYGSRAANGVIMITTKKGKKGRPTASANIRQGFLTRGIPEYSRVDSKQYYELFWEAYRNAAVAAGNSFPDAGVIASNKLTGPNGLVYNAYNVPGNKLVDPVTGKLDPNAKLLWNESWSDALFHQASRTNANVNFSGAGDNSDYYLSAGYLSEDGILRNSGYKKYNLRLTMDVNPVKWLNAGINLDGSAASRKDLLSTGTFTSNPFYYSREIGPIYPVYQHDLSTGAYVDSNGQHRLDYGVPEQMGTRPYAGRSNLVGTLALDDQTNNLYNTNANMFGEIKFLRDFSFKASVGATYYSTYQTYYQNNQYGDAAPSTPGGADGGRSTKTDDQTFSLTGNEVLNWKRSFAKHNIRALAGHENYKYKFTYLSANSSGFLYPGQTELDNGTRNFGPASSRVDNLRIESYFSNVNYDFDQRYLVSGSFRRDGSSRFADSVRWGNFYSVGAGWRISQENFLRKLKWLNEVKLRGSYGEQGNDNIGLFYQYKNYYYANGDGTYNPPTRPANPDLKWEKNKIANVGLDFGIFNRLTGTVEVYKKISDNLLFDVPLAISLGSASVYQNIGSMKNTGIELQLGYNAIMRKNFNWRVDFNISHFKNVVTKIPPVQTIKGIQRNDQKILPGHSIYDFYLYEYAGVDASNGDALYYKDITDASGKVTGRTVTNIINSSTTKYYHGSAIPKFSGGLSNSFNYKNFDLSVLLTYSYGSLFFDGNYQSIMHRGDNGVAFSTDILGRWQKPGDVTTVPRLQTDIAGQDGNSTRWLIDGSYLNIKNITLSYKFSKPLADRLHLGGVQVYGNVDNAWLFTAKKGSDPQRSFDGTSDASYTPFRTVNFGINFNLL